MATDVSGVVLHKLLKSPEEALEIFPKLKPSFFGAGHVNVFTAIHKFYNKHNKVPSFYDLLLVSRDGITKNNIQALEQLEVPEDIDWDILVDALINQYTQEETLTKLDKFLDTITSLDSQEIKQDLADILFYLEEKTHISEEVYTMSDIHIMDEEELTSRIPLGINNSFDAETGGIALTETVFIGGKRGSGKSIVACNLCVNQFRQGNVTVIFTIEMRAREIYLRIISTLAGIRFSALRKNQLTEEEKQKAAKALCTFYEEPEEYYEEFQKTNDFKKLEINLAAHKKLKKDNQIIIVDNQHLSLADIDMNIQKIKSQFGDKLKLAVVDYVNQIEIEDIYNWQSQINLSKGLKSMARKHNIVVAAPYQIDDSGEARFAKGLLDAVDIAIILKAAKDHIKFQTTKSRNISATEFASPMNWETLEISPQDYQVLEGESEEEPKEEKKFSKIPKATGKQVEVRKKDDLPF